MARLAAGLACAVAFTAAPAAAPAQAVRLASVLQLFLAHAEEPPVAYRALRHLEAHNGRFHASAWMDAWTEFDDAHGLRFEIVAEGGNEYIRAHVLHAALEGERKLWEAHEPQRASLTPDNYRFRATRPIADGLAPLDVTPRRKDMLLIDGTLFVDPGDGELRRVEGRLSKTPSFWTRRVEIVRTYGRIAGVRVPVSIESVAHVLIAGLSTFSMTYDYETVNGQHVGDPVPGPRS